MKDPTFWRLCALACIVMLSYALAGSAAQSLFLAAYSSTLLPWVWAAVAVVSTVCVLLVNYAASHMGVVRLFLWAIGSSAGILLLLLVAHSAGLPGMPFAIYVWKDIYVVVLVELFWTFANVAFAVHTASRTYGLYCAAGSVGAVVGNLAIGPLAQRIGTFNTLWLILPTLALTAWGCESLGRQIGADLPMPTPSKNRGRLRAGWQIMRDSRFLTPLMLMVLAVQLAMTLIDFQFNEILEVAYPELDGRTAVIGELNAAVGFLSFVIQLATSTILRVAGLPATLLGVPVILGATLIGFLLQPGFVSMTIAKITSKTLDYSIFRAAKEMVYIPLSYAEKTQGKAVVDMLTYRAAKGAVPVVLGVTGIASPWLLGSINLALTLVWLALTWVILARRQTLPTHIACVLLILTTSLTGVPAQARSVWEMPRPGQDHSAYRRDCDIFGWNRSLTEVAAVGSEVQRGPNGEQRGEVYLQVTPIGAAQAKHEVITHNVSHAALAHDPVPMAYAHEFMWTIERTFMAMWPIKPKKQKPAGGMDVTLLWEADAQGGGLCQPTVGFLLTYHGQTRYMPHLGLDLQAPCALLRCSDSRTVWGRADVAAAMTRFDYAPTQDNEQSRRFVVSAVWSAARALRITLVVPPDAPATAVQSLRRTLAKYGAVTLRTDAAPAPTQTNQPSLVVQIAHQNDTRLLAQHLLRALDGDATQLSPVADGNTDLLVRVRWSGATGRAQDAATPVDPNVEPATPDEAQYLKDWTVP